MADFYMPVAKEIYLPKHIVRAIFLAFPTGLATSSIYVDESEWSGIPESHMLLFYYAKVARIEP